MLCVNIDYQIRRLERYSQIGDNIENMGPKVLYVLALIGFANVVNFVFGKLTKYK